VHAPYKVLLGDTEVGHLIEGHVDAVALADVLADIAQDIGQLVGSSKGEGGTVDRLEAALQAPLRLCLWFSRDRGRVTKQKEQVVALGLGKVPLRWCHIGRRDATKERMV
jgi:hypothetical protein